ncbi:dTDP-4-dehydrorhamnose reductase [Lutibacter sp.]|uniref:dTDP-4-dehydrorhamnose reductase n=1 Tax=Lutibacter sp. TaxID=1925666 RepID=UPI0025C20ECC|nr:dTDP-4-dehydrorhamnose reductase [Lutibacter sp.]MCF6182117.1 dTDP-4-dehydrorhamnose reductase [Lutibacter sp.]
MTNILITGANGQLGLTFKNIQKKYTNYNIFFAEKKILDITNLEKIEKYLVKNQIDAIINCAAYTQVDKAEDEIELADKINYTAVKYLAELAKKHSIILVHISTDYVFDGTSKNPYTETDKTNPQNCYGKTKLKGEEAIQEINPVNSIIIRTSWLYSEFGNNFVKTICRIGKDKDKIQVVSDQVGSPTYAKDLAEAILTIIPKLKNENTEIVHFANTGSCSWFTFAEEIIKISNIACVVEPIKSTKFKTKAKRPNYSLLNTNKIQNTFGINIPNWKISLKKCLIKMHEV